MIKKLLNYSSLYNLSMNFLGGANSRKKFLSDYVSFSPNYKVLDLGCGTAQILSLLSNVEYTGIDASQDYINTAQKRFPNGKFICSYFDETTKLDGKYDLVLALGLIHHMDEKTSKNLITNACNILKDGGMLITLDNVLFQGQNLLTRWIIKQDRGNYIRNLREYTSLFPQDIFKNIQFDLREDLLRIPYSHIISICTK
jgi:SAM-dependent methyltransferase